MGKSLLQSYYCITFAFNTIDILFIRKFSLNVILFITNRTIITGNWKELQTKDGFLLGPHRVRYSNFAPIHKNTSILSRIEFNRKGFIYKFEGLKYWSYEPSGRQWKGGQNGEDLKYLLIPTGFNAVFHNGMANNSMMIGVSCHRDEMRHLLSNNWRLILIGFQVFYYLIKDYYLEPAKGYDTKGYKGGRDGENFPAVITADFSLFASNSQDGYEVYIFREDKYCFRSQKLKSGQYVIIQFIDYLFRT